MKGIKYLTGDDHIFQLHEYNIDYKANEIYLFGEELLASYDAELAEPGVEFTMANRFIRNLNLLARKSKDPILVHLKSCGGMWEEGMAIYDAIKLCPNYVTILNYTHARSMTSLIYLAGDHRVMMPHSTYMFHQGTYEYGGTVKQAITDYEELKKTSAIMIEIYADHLKEYGNETMKKWSKRKIGKWILDKMDKKEEVYFNAEEAVDLGFANEIFDGDLNRLANLEK